jgi:hypothetical protein
VVTIGPDDGCVTSTTTSSGADLRTRATLNKVPKVLIWFWIITISKEGDQAGATATVDQLEPAWDTDRPTLQPLDTTQWTFLDGQIDTVLQVLSAMTGDNATRLAALHASVQWLG